VIPGRNNRFSVTPTKTGDYIGQCAELCGLDHSIMRFKVQVVDRATFDKWFADQVAGTKTAVQQPQ
jgi:cytochrome c oxidase subunit 2